MPSTNRAAVNAARRAKTLRDGAAAAGMDIETFAAHRAAALRARETAKAQKAAAREASAVRGLERARRAADAASAAQAARKRQTVEATPQPARDRRWLVEPVIRSGDLAIVDGDPGAALALSLDLAIAISAGTPAWAGWPIHATAAKVMVLDAAFTLDIGARVRTTEIMRQVEVDDRLRISRGGLLIGSKASSAAFLSGVREAGAPSLIIVNSLAALCAQSGINPDDPAVMSAMLDSLTGIQSRLGGPAILLLGGSDSALGEVADRVFDVRRSGQSVTMATGDEGMTLQFRLVPIRRTVIPVPVDPATKKEGV